MTTFTLQVQTVRQRFLVLFTGAALVTIGLIAVLMMLLPDTGTDLLTDDINLRTYGVILFVLNGIWLFLGLRGLTRIASYGLIVTLSVAALLTPPEYVPLSLIAVMVAAVLADSRPFMLIIAVLGGKMLVEIGQYVIAQPTDALEMTRFVGTRLIVVVLAVAVRYIIELNENTLSSAGRSAVLLRTSAEIGAATSQLADLQSLFNRVIELVQERFGYYHVQIFLVSGDQAMLRASTGEIGARLLARGHQLSIGSQSVIGQVTMRGEPVIASDTDRDQVHYRNELLINTRSELAVPIRDGSVVVGALDVQSIEPNAFDQTDMEALQVIADFLGTALRNADAYEQQERIAEQNRRLLTEAEENIRLIQRLNRELTRVSWENFSRTNTSEPGVILADDQISPLQGWTDALRSAGLEKRTITQQDGGRNLVAVPLTLRGEVIGAIEVESGTENDPATIAMIEDVAQRLAISLENARLYEDAQTATAQEQFINNLSARYQATTSVEELLRLTLVEVSETLGAQHGAIRLGKLELLNGESSQEGAAR